MFDLMPFDRKNRGLTNLFEELDRNFFSNFTRGFFADVRTDILDKGDMYVLQAELPGFRKEDIHIEVNDDYLTISAEQKEDKEEKKGNYVRRERRYGSFTRSFHLNNVDPDKITAEYKNGILELQLPKLDKTPPSSRRIDIH